MRGLLTSLRRGTSLTRLGLGLLQGAVGPYAAPTGFRWGYVTENSIITTENGQPVVELEKVA